MYRVGIDLGGTNIVAGVTDDHYNIIAKASCKTATPRPAELIIDDMARMAKEAVANAGLTMDDISHVGIGSPGTCNSTTGVVEFSNNLGFKNLPMCQMMEDRLNKKVYLENDANAAAYGEFMAGAGKGTESCVCITLGTGVGGGIVFNGKIFSGFNFAGAELGHTVIIARGEPCSCGRYGCWEAYASSTALIRQTRRAMDTDPLSQMWKVSPSIDQVNGKTAFDAMRLGDETAKKVVDNYIYYVACGLINVINIFQPEVICIGGGICKEGDTLLKPLQKYIESERYSKYSTKQSRLVTAALGNDAGVIGAAFLDCVK